MNMTLLIKRISAWVLAASFFLPLTQCSQKQGDSSPPATLSASNAFDWPGLFSTVALLLFFWPLAIELWRMMKGLHPPSRKASWTEVGLSVLSFAGISWLVLTWHLNFGASIRYGAYLAYGSAFAYGVTSLVEAIKSNPRRECPPGAGSNSSA
ncbi:hypothetical protein [Dyella choica]|uniref:Uncharacterized protein n=1 Tax=Dyella choica TaxID=1927959 RepID=A0A3S0R3V6_9GAMM|nr:hypothetical protein [Dyella choica]RUL75933.1 hypothetical protein EKH80_09405 [Dyella choica]